MSRSFVGFVVLVVRLLCKTGRHQRFSSLASQDNSNNTLGF